MKTPAGATEFLAFINWKVLWHAEFRWTAPADKPTVVMKDARIDIFNPFAAGKPPNANIQGILSNPAGPTANQLDKKAFNDAFANRRQPLLVQSDKLPANLPADFFK